VAFWLACVFLAADCGSGDADRASAREGVESPGEMDTEVSGKARVIPLSEREMADSGIELAEASPDSIETRIELPGEVTPDQDRIAHLAPRFAGIAKEVKKNVGDAVRSGDVLAVVESSETLTTYPLRSRIDGVVIEKRIAPGEAVSADSEAFVVADLSRVWINLSVYQRDLDRVKVGQVVVVSTGEGRAQAEGALSYVAPVVDERTRTAVARVVLPNPDGVWRPGLFVTGLVTIATVEVNLAVPASAPQMLDGGPVLFVSTLKGLAPRRVRLGRADAQHVEVISGLAAGERFVSRGSFLLLSELEKEAFGEGDED
jgi:membrane fusion protein, heavy metal efflux system